MRSVLLFSDVDDTMLDRSGRYALGPRALARYRTRLRIVLASSRSVAELAAVQRDLQLDGPVVAENGAVLAFPATDGARDVVITGRRSWRIERIGAAADVLRRTLQASLEGATIELQPSTDRVGSVLFRAPGGASSATLHSLVARLRGQGLVVSSGGEWFALTGGADKGTGVRTMLREMAWPAEESLVAGVGDGDNDLPMLRTVSRGYVVRRQDGTWHPELASIAGVTLLAPRGVIGWRTVIRQLAREAET